MNIILFSTDEIKKPLPLLDKRAKHLLTIIKSKTGDIFHAGIINKQSGKAIITSITKTHIHFTFTPNNNHHCLFPITMLIGIPRPNTAKRLIKDLTTMGVSKLYFFIGEKSEKSYSTSNLWKEKKYQSYLVQGAEQGVSPLLPQIELFYSLRKSKIAIEKAFNKLAFDNYENEGFMNKINLPSKATTLAIGPERGFSDNERIFLKDNGFTFYNMGTRVLRTETACISAVTAILLKTNLFK